VNEETLRKMMTYWDAKAKKAFDTYQETGAARYNREREKAEDLADALRIAFNAADDHYKAVCLKHELAEIVSLAEQCEITGDGKLKDELVKKTLTYGRMNGITKT
jgi:hypothetical protein